VISITCIVAGTEEGMAFLFQSLNVRMRYSTRVAPFTTAFAACGSSSNENG
jgi:hypothetical protein